MKLIVFDLDGTVLSKKTGEVSHRTIQSLEDAGNRGAVLVAATGRATALIPESIRKIRGLHWLISSNGACVSENSENPGAKVLFQDEMNIELVLSVLELAGGYGSAFNLYCQEGIVMEGKSLGIYDGAQRQTQRGRQWVGFLRRHAIVVPSASAFLKGSGYRVEKFSCLQDGSLDWNPLCKRLQKVKGIEAVLASRFEIEITNQNTNKGSGLAKLEKTLGIEREDVLVFGDSRNDISMKGASGYFVAVRDAEQDVFQYVDFIAASSNQDGVASFLENYYR